MIISVEIILLDGKYPHVMKDVTVYGQFNVNRLNKWLWELQQSLTNSHFYPGVYSYEVDDSMSTVRFNRITKQHTPEEIKEVVERYYEQNVREGITTMLNQNQSNDACEMRRIAWGLMEKFTPISQEKIGKMYDTSRSNVCTSIKRFKELPDVDPKFKKRLNDILILLGEYEHAY